MAEQMPEYMSEYVTRTEVGPYVTAHVRPHDRKNVRTHAKQGHGPEHFPALLIDDQSRLNAVGSVRTLRQSARPPVNTCALPSAKSHPRVGIAGSQIIVVLREHVLCFHPLACARCSAQRKKCDRGGPGYGLHQPKACRHFMFLNN